MTNCECIKDIGTEALVHILTVAFLEGALSVVSISEDDRVCKVSPAEYSGEDIEEVFNSDFAEKARYLYEKYLNSDVPDDGLHAPILKYICDGDI
jgi:hypothetical protein